jgi:hypothetical protein
MSNPTPHGSGVRGLDLARASLFFEGAFGRLFRALPPAEFGGSDQDTLDNLQKLAGAMVGPDDNAKDGADPEESGIPALYTYLGQFVDHDLTFDPASSLQQQNDIDGLVDYRTPRFDLDSVYGRGPDDQPYLYRGGPGTPTLLVGTMALKGGTPADPAVQDLPRSGGTPPRAIIGDPRNDENVIVSQLHGLFLRFHNRFAAENPDLPFGQVQQAVRFYYQWLLIHDFLPTLISAPVLQKVFPHLASGKSLADQPPVLKLYHAKNEAFMPLEFSVAAYRFGHSMVRPGYRLNDNDKTLLPIFGANDPDIGRPKSLRGFMPPDSTWGLDWARFIDIEDRPNGVMLDDDGNVAGTGKPPTAAQKAELTRRLQLAYRIDTSLVKPLSTLPVDVADKIIRALALRNLQRGWRLRLPSGQAVARALGIEPLKRVVIGSFEDGAEVTPDPKKPPFDLNRAPGFEAFRGNCPLWTYCLAETFESDVEGKFGVKSKLLGPVGGGIVAETFAGLLTYDSHSFLNVDPLWKPKIGGGRFGLKELVRYALGK